MSMPGSSEAGFARVGETLKNALRKAKKEDRFVRARFFPLFYLTL
jgi:hypothetical protein